MAGVRSPCADAGFRLPRAAAQARCLTRTATLFWTYPLAVRSTVEPPAAADDLAADDLTPVALQPVVLTAVLES
jgi:hypothetical protein